MKRSFRVPSRGAVARSVLRFLQVVDVPRAILIGIGEATMFGALEPLCEDGPVRRLLRLYRLLKEKQPEGEWHDRLTELPGVERRELSRLYGLLLAYGWLETRIARESLAASGGVKQAYQITRDGLRALERTEDRFGNIAFAPPDEEFAPAIDE